MTRPRRGSGLVKVSDIMRRLHHTIAKEIEAGREGLTADAKGVILDRLGSVSAADSDEDACVKMLTDKTEGLSLQLELF